MDSLHSKHASDVQQDRPRPYGHVHAASVQTNKLAFYVTKNKMDLNDIYGSSTFLKCSVSGKSAKRAHGVPGIDSGSTTTLGKCAF